MDKGKKWEGMERNFLCLLWASGGCTYTCKKFSAIGRDPASVEDSLRTFFFPFQIYWPQLKHLENKVLTNVTEDHKTELFTPLSLIKPGYWNTAARSPGAFFWMNHPTSQPVFREKFLQPYDHLHGLLWTLSNRSTSIVWGFQGWIQYSSHRIQ
nr:uncharacterized protein LOC102072464 isoform X2 [Zonotrichia albicollis]